MAARDEAAKSHTITEVLRAGRSLFIAGMSPVFPWVLAAELLQLLPSGNPGGLLDTDLSLFLDPRFLIKALALGLLQAFLYCVAIIRLAKLASGASGAVTWPALRATPAVLIAYIIYTVLMLLGLGLGMLFFSSGLLFLGPLAGLLLSLIPLGPTAAASTALAFFVYPAVLERRGPIASLNDSARLARSGWMRASLVVTVPALALFAAWLVGNGAELFHGMSDTLKQFSSMQEDMSTDQLQALLSGVAGQAVPQAWGWRILGAVAGAFAWWYTLAVCYAEYRDLKARAAAREDSSKSDKKSPH